MMMTTTRPQLFIQDLPQVGRHNGGVGQTRARLEREAVWKRQRTVIVVPAGAAIPAKVYLTHCNLIAPPNNGVCRVLAQGVEVGAAYTSAVEQVLAHPELSTWEYLLTLEHDNMPPMDGLLRLISRLEDNPRYAAIGGLYFTKGHGGQAQIWGDPSDLVLNFRPQLPDPAGGLVECNGTGMGFTLYRLKMFKDARLRRPWFVTNTRGGVTTQDLYFWMDARGHGYRCAIDCSVKVGHYDAEHDIVW